LHQLGSTRGFVQFLVIVVILERRVRSGDSRQRAANEPGRLPALRRERGLCKKCPEARRSKKRAPYQPGGDRTPRFLYSEKWIGGWGGRTAANTPNAPVGREAAAAGPVSVNTSKPPPLSTDSPVAVVRLRIGLDEATLALGSHDIGRVSECDIVIDDEKVSRLHARLAVDQSGASLEDLDSTYGTFVNGTRLARKRVRLAVGDQVTLGGTRIDVLSVPAAPSASGIPNLTATVAAQALATGNPLHAESLLEDSLEGILRAARAGSACSTAELGRAVGHALSLARALRSLRWLEYSLDLLEASESLPTDPQIRELTEVIDAFAQLDARRLRNYADWVRAQPPSIEKLRAVDGLDALLRRAATTG